MLWFWVFLQRLQSEVNIKRDRRLEAENAQELGKVALASLRQDLELEGRNLRSAEAEHKARVKQSSSTTVELERAKSNDLQGWVEHLISHFLLRRHCSWWRA